MSMSALRFLHKLPVCVPKSLVYHLTLVALIWHGTASISHASTPDPEAILEQARSAQRVDRSIQVVRMTLRSKNGSERTREFEMRIRREDDTLKSWTRFRHPSDVAGTQLVVVDQPDQVDDLLMYLPALGRVSRIAGRARSGAFMGSDFLFEDLEFSGVNAQAATLVEDETSSYIIDVVPETTSSYGRIRLTVNKDDYLAREVVYFGPKGNHIKTLSVEKVAKEGDAVIPIVSTMTDIKRKTSTRLEVLEYRLNVDPSEIPDETFTATFMERSQ